MIYTKEDFNNFLTENIDEKYKDFHTRLTRTAYSINGVRIPILRAYGKNLIKECDNLVEFIQCDSECYEEVMLKGILLSGIMKKSNEFGILDKFLYQIDDWAVCDVSCGGLKRKDDVYLNKCLDYVKSQHIWTARWGLVAFMTNFCDKSNELRQAVYNIIAEDYYIDMAIAWLIQVLCIKNREVAEEFLASKKIGDSVKKMAVRKIKDSFRISQDDKKYFESLAFKSGSKA